MDWFERLTGFPETDYETTRARLRVSAGELSSSVNGQTFGIGNLELVSLGELRKRASSGNSPAGCLTLHNVSGDVRRLHQMSAYTGALFQVASQFNLLEMVSPEVAPEDGVTRYQHDHTQGPACAIAAGAATIYRNYFVLVDGEVGQNVRRQLNGLADLGLELAVALGVSVSSLWDMRNGYAMCTETGLGAIERYLLSADDTARDSLRCLLRIGVQSDVQVTDWPRSERQIVSQAFCSALPVSYSNVEPRRWEAFARLILEAAYEATLWAAVCNMQRGASSNVLLTRLGGGAFGNADIWIDDAMRRALEVVREFALEVCLVSFSEPTAAMIELEKAYR